MTDLTLTAADGHILGAYRADPSGTPRGGIVVIQEIFGVNSHIRSVCDRLAEAGYVAIAPALFDRVEPNFQSGYSSKEVEHARTFMANPDWDGYMNDTDAARAVAAEAGKVGIIGFCLGGAVAFLAAARYEGFSAASGFYGARIPAFADEKPHCPVQLHYGELDQGIPMSNVDEVRAKRPECDIYVYEGAGHGFNCDVRGSYDPAAAKKAWARSMDLFGQHIG
ncbi:MAG: dienelactone hydrolase family protein [Rhizobiales bacterium]|nr:dienelactone hydrolase family protein [Hyphomicrobiales bacterium]